MWVPSAATHLIGPGRATTRASRYRWNEEGDHKKGRPYVELLTLIIVYGKRGLTGASETGAVRPLANDFPLARKCLVRLENLSPYAMLRAAWKWRETGSATYEAPHLRAGVVSNDTLPLGCSCAWRNRRFHALRNARLMMRYSPSSLGKSRLTSCWIAFVVCGPRANMN